MGLFSTARAHIKSGGSLMTFGVLRPHSMRSLGRYRVPAQTWVVGESTRRQY